MALIKNYSPGPWGACRDGDCTCGFIWSKTADHPVAKVESGEWGDEYAALRVVEEPSIVGRVQIEAFKDIIGYGRIDPEVSRQNALLIALSPEMFELLQLGLTLQTEGEYTRWRVIVRELLQGETDE